jgi:hypothetical protein
MITKKGQTLRVWPFFKPNLFHITHTLEWSLYRYNRKSYRENDMTSKTLQLSRVVPYLRVFFVVMFFFLASAGSVLAAVAHDAASESHTGTTGATSTASFSWTHTPVGTPKGVLVFVTTISETDHVTSVTYGGTAMTRISGGAAIDTATEPGRIDTFFLGASIPTGAQTIVVNRTNNATIMYAAASTMTAGADTEVYYPGIVLLQQNSKFAVQSVSDGPNGVNSVRYAAAYSGRASVLAAGSGSTVLNNIDFGAYVSNFARETTAGQGARNVGFSQATSDDCAAVHLAVREIGPITFSGTLYSDEGSTAITTGKTVNLVIGTSTPSVHSATTNGAGAWSINLLCPQTNCLVSTPVLAYVDGDSGTRAAVMTKNTGAASISNLDLYKDHVIVSHEATAGTTTRNADLAFYDSDNDADIQFTSNGGSLTLAAGQEFFIKSGKTFDPNGATTLPHLKNNGTFVSASTTISGNFANSGTTTHGGILWTSRTSAADNNWLSVTYGNGLFVAVAQSGTGNRVMTSPDGITWTSRTSAANNSWYSVTYGNGLFVAVANSGTGNRVMTSPDGITWTSRTSAADNQWNSVTYGNGLFVAVSYDGTGNRVMTSPDGITWTSRTSAADNQWYSVTYGNGLFVAVFQLPAPATVS